MHGVGIKFCLFFSREKMCWSFELKYIQDIPDMSGMFGTMSSSYFTSVLPGQLYSATDTFTSYSHPHSLQVKVKYRVSPSTRNMLHFKFSSLLQIKCWGHFGFFQTKKFSFFLKQIHKVKRFRLMRD